MEENLIVFLYNFFSECLFILCLGGIVSVGYWIGQKSAPHHQTAQKLQSCNYIYKNRPLRKAGSAVRWYGILFFCSELLWFISEVIFCFANGIHPYYLVEALKLVNWWFLAPLLVGTIIRKRISDAKPPLDTLSQKVQFVYDLYDHNSRPFLQRIYPNGTAQMEQTVLQMAEVCGIDLTLAKYSVVYQLLSMYGEIRESKGTSAAVAEWMRNYYSDMRIDLETMQAVVGFVRGEAPAATEEAPTAVEEVPAAMEEVPAAITKSEMSFCFHCSGKLPKDSVFCPSCGEKMLQHVVIEQNEQPRFCTNCGQAIPEGHHFCGVCGTKRFEPIMNPVILRSKRNEGSQTYG